MMFLITGKRRELKYIFYITDLNIQSRTSTRTKKMNKINLKNRKQQNQEERNTIKKKQNRIEPKNGAEPRART